MSSSSAAARGQEAVRVARAGGELAPQAAATGGGARLRPRVGADERQREQDGEVGEGVHAEAPALAVGRDDRAADHRADEARAVHHRRVERDGVGQIGAAADQLHQDRLARRRVAGADDAEHEVADDQMPGRDVAQRHQEEHGHRLQRGDDVRRQQHAAPVEAVDEDAGQRRQDEERHLQRERGEAEQEGRVRQPVHQPAGGDHLQPGAHLRHALADEEQPEVAVAEGAQACRQVHARAVSFSCCSLSLPTVDLNSARRARNSSTTLAGARLTNDSFDELAFGLRDLRLEARDLLRQALALGRRIDLDVEHDGMPFHRLGRRVGRGQAIDEHFESRMKVITALRVASVGAPAMEKDSGPVNHFCFAGQGTPGVDHRLGALDLPFHRPASIFSGCDFGYGCSMMVVALLAGERRDDSARALR